jgi:hypothetical protein
VGKIGKFKHIENYGKTRADKGINRAEGQAVKHNLKKHKRLLRGRILPAENLAKPGPEGM